MRGCDEEIWEGHADDKQASIDTDERPLLHLRDDRKTAAQSQRRWVTPALLAGVLLVGCLAAERKQIMYSAVAEGAVQLSSSDNQVVNVDYELLGTGCCTAYNDDPGGGFLYNGDGVESLAACQEICTSSFPEQCGFVQYGWKKSTWCAILAKGSTCLPLKAKGSSCGSSGKHVQTYAAIPSSIKWTTLGAGCCLAYNANSSGAWLYNDGDVESEQACQAACENTFPNQCGYVNYGWKKSTWCAILPKSAVCTPLSAGQNDCGSSGTNGVQATGRVYSPSASSFPNVGVYMTMTNKWIDFLNTVVLPKFSKLLVAAVNTAFTKVPDGNFSYQGFWSGASVSSATLSDFNITSTTASFSPGGGVLLALSGISFEMTAEVYVRGTIFSTKGTFSCTSESSSYISVLLSADFTNGRLGFGVPASGIGLHLNLDTDFHTTWLNTLNPLSTPATLAMKAFIGLFLPEVLEKAMEGVAAESGITTSVKCPEQINTTSTTAINMSVAGGKTYTNGLYSSLSGAPLDLGGSGLEYKAPEAPTEQESLLVLNHDFESAPAVALSIRQYVLNGQLWLLQAQGKLNVSFAPNNLTAVSLVALAPKITNTYPGDTPMEVQVYASTAPEVETSGGDGSQEVALKGAATVSFVALQPDKPAQLAFSLEIPLSTSVEFVASTGVVYAQVDSLEVTPMKKGTSNVGLLTINAASNVMIKSIVNNGLVPMLNAELEKGGLHVPAGFDHIRVRLTGGMVSILLDA